MRRRALTASVAVGAGLLALGAAPAASAADGCSNAEFRVGPSSLLPDCRAYELVTPADKDAYTLVMPNSPAYSSASGDGATFSTVTPFADPRNGNVGRYVAIRGADGWTSRNVMPRYCRADQSGLIDTIVVESFSRDFLTTIVQDPANSNCDPDDHAGKDLYRAEADGGMTWLSHAGAPKLTNDTAELGGLSADGSHVVFATNEKLVLPLEASRSGKGLYERVGDAVRVVGLQTDGTPINSCGAAAAGDKSAPGRVSADGRVIFLTSGSSASVPGCSPATDDGGQLYARIDASRTVLLSESQLAVPESRQQPTFLGATDDGRKAFFASNERLTNDATVGGGLYEYDLSSVLDGGMAGVLRFLSPSIDGAPAAIVGRHVAGMSEDGSVVYFIANGVLAPGAPSGMKVYRAAAGAVEFVGTFAGSQFEPSDDSSASPDASKFAFLHTPTGSTGKQIYLYDAAAPGTLTCVSCVPPGETPSGDAKFYGGNSGRPTALGMPRYVTNDGRVFFTSPDRLASRDTNDKLDVYEYSAGERHLISSGGGKYNSMLTGTTGSGRDVFFVTNDSLLPEDFDNGDQDMYVARVGGGFPQPTGDAAPCVGDACQGGVVGTPGVLFSGTAGYVGAGNIPAPPVKKDDETTSKLSLVKGSRTVRGTSGYVRVRVSGEGKIRTSGSGLRRSTRTVKRSGTSYRIPVRLSSRARRTLDRRGRVQVRVTVRFTPEEGKARSARVRMTFRKASSRAKASKARAKESRSGERAVSVGAASDGKGGR